MIQFYDYLYKFLDIRLFRSYLIEISVGPMEDISRWCCGAVIRLGLFEINVDADHYYADIAKIF